MLDIVFCVQLKSWFHSIGIVYIYISCFKEIVFRRLISLLGSTISHNTQPIHISINYYKFLDRHLDSKSKQKESLNHENVNHYDESTNVTTLSIFPQQLQGAGNRRRFEVLHQGVRSKYSSFVIEGRNLRVGILITYWKLVAAGCMGLSPRLLVYF